MKPVIPIATTCRIAVGALFVILAGFAITSNPGSGQPMYYNHISGTKHDLGVFRDTFSKKTNPARQKPHFAFLAWTIPGTSPLRSG